MFELASYYYFTREFDVLTFIISVMHVAFSDSNVVSSGILILCFADDVSD